MDINKVTFGDFSIGAKRSNSQKNDEKQETPRTSVVGEERISNNGALTGALDGLSALSKTQVIRSNAKIYSDEYLNALVNKYNTPEQQEQIEADVIKELGGNGAMAANEFKALGFSEAQSNALGAIAVTRNVNDANVVIQE